MRLPDTVTEETFMPTQDDRVSESNDEVLLEKASSYVARPTWRLIITPYFVVGGYLRPNWWHRLWHRVLLGWRWERME